MDASECDTDISHSPNVLVFICQVLVLVIGTLVQVALDDDDDSACRASLNVCVLHQNMSSILQRKTGFDVNLSVLAFGIA